MPDEREPRALILRQGRERCAEAAPLGVRLVAARPEVDAVALPRVRLAARAGKRLREQRELLRRIAAVAAPAGDEDRRLGGVRRRDGNDE